MSRDDAPVPTIFEKGKPGRRAYRLPPADVPPASQADIVPASMRRPAPPALPEVSELEIVRHFTRLSRRNVSVDGEFYPLGSCTMKYNPRLDEAIAALPGFAALHPDQPEESTQGLLAVLHELQEMLSHLLGFPAISLQPAAGAHGEFTSLLVIQARLRDRGEKRPIVLIPDSAHGTNPASARMAGFQTVEVRSCARGRVDLDDLRAKISRDVAALMITNPNTLGLFDERIVEIARLMHAAGGYLYMDGANMNALIGRVRPRDFGVDIMHVNLHKTVSTPHGGGGPGAGPIACTEELAPYLPIPWVERTGDAYRLVRSAAKSIGRVKGAFGNVGVLVRAWAYLKSHSAKDLAAVSGMAVLNANYLLARLSSVLDVAHDETCMHECVLSASTLKAETGVRTLDVAKRLLDKGFHAPTIYFPLIVPEAIMIEPTETESKETLDAFADALTEIVAEARRDPDLVKHAPHETPVRRLDEVAAARNPCLCAG